MNKLMQPTLDALRACGGQASNDDIANRIVEAQALPLEGEGWPGTIRRRRGGLA